MFGKFMNNYYYGKSGKGDFRKEDLPHNRRELFRDTLKTRLSALCRINLLYMIIFLPAMIMIMYFTFTGIQEAMTRSTIQLNNYEEYAEMYSTAGQELSITEEQYNQLKEETNGFDYTAFFQNILYHILIWLVPCIAITGPFTAGLSYITRNWARDEHAFIWTDFKDAVKENWKQSLVISAITSILPLAAYVGWEYYGQLSQENVILIVPQILVVLVGVIWAISVTYMHPLIVTYELKMKDVIRNGLLLGVARLPMSVAIRLLHCVPVLIGAMPLLAWMIFGFKRRTLTAWCMVLVTWLLLIFPVMLRNYRCGAEFDMDSNRGEMLFHSGAAILGAVTGENTGVIRDRMARETYAYLDAHPEQYPNTRARDAYCQKKYMELIRQYPGAFFRTHLPQWTMLLPDLPTFLENNRLTATGRGTLDIMRKDGVYAALKHYLDGRLGLAIPVLPFVLITGLLYLGACMLLIIWLYHWKTRWLLLILFGIF
ncbi:MAG: YesL family protein, partial [Clostridia bacterium]|nr:YesL family protein [Clostridia bacterium]